MTSAYNTRSGKGNGRYGFRDGFFAPGMDHGMSMRAYDIYVGIYIWKVQSDDGGDDVRECVSYERSL